MNPIQTLAISALPVIFAITLHEAAHGYAARHFGETFPWGTLLVNVIGSFAIGFFATLTGPDGRWLVPGRWREFFMIGICGGYTTFSSFSLQTLSLAEEGEWLRAGGNILGSVALCLVVAAVLIPRNQ